jgi:superfamily II helicase
MSAPKDYSPSPKYSMNVFNGKLNDVFVLQSKIKSQIIKLQKLHVSNNKLDIHFDCKADLKKIGLNLNELLRPLVFNYKGTFNQATYNNIDTEISERIILLNSQKQSLDEIEREFYDKENDYNNYLEYIKYNKNSAISFEYFKQNICNYF